MTGAVMCDKCRGPLFLDRESVRELARIGQHGGRIYCTAGCTDLWLKTALVIVEPDAEPGDGRGKYQRPVREFLCPVCDRPSETRGNNTVRCKGCTAEAQRGRDHARWEAKRARRALLIAPHAASA